MKGLFALNTILILTGLIWPVALLSQSEEAHHQKYWYYRTRLTNDFMKVGLNAGESIPFNQRGTHTTDFYVVNIELLAGDASSSIGYYLAVLGTEYYLLSENGQDVSKTKHEIFCALNALNRLDYKAEGLYEPGAESLNGFFIRDDIPKTFVTDPEYYKHFNYYNAGINNNTKSRGFCSWYQAGANKLTSSWVRNSELQADISMSQDQVYCILLGISFISKFVPTWETDNGQVFGYGSGQASLTQEARNIATRIITHIRDSKKLDGSPCKANITTGWNVLNPVNCKEVETGNDAHSFSYALAEAECFINFPKLTQKNGSRRTNIPASCSGKGYHNGFSKTTGFMLWNASAKSLLYLPSSPHYAADSRGQIANISAVCNCVYGTPADGIMQRATGSVRNVKGLNWIGQGVNFIWGVASSAVSSFIPLSYVNQTRMAINMNSYINGKGSPSNQLGSPGSPFDHAPLARSVLHNTRYDRNKKYTIRYLLDVAPCDNIYNLNNLNYGHYEWSSDNRLDRPDRIGWYGHNYDSGNPFASEFWRPPTGEYNGIDYMLYHNLWYVHQLQKGKKIPVVDLSDIFVSGGDNSNPKTIGAFETISAANVTISTTDAESVWRSGKTIYFGPGTEISGDFHAEINKFNCATDIADISSDGKQIILPEDDTKSVKQPATKEDFVIAPNPTEGLFTIDFTVEKNEKIFIQLFDINGNLVLALPDLKRADTGYKVDIGNLTDGVYILKGFTSLGRLITKKLIKF